MNGSQAQTEVQSPLEAPAGTPAPAGTAKRKAGRPRKVAAEKASEFEGMTTVACCDACTPTRCIISAKSYCGHPAKGGLHQNEMLVKAATERFRQAKIFPQASGCRSAEPIRCRGPQRRSNRVITRSCPAPRHQRQHPWPMLCCGQGRLKG